MAAIKRTGTREAVSPRKTHEPKKAKSRQGHSSSDFPIVGLGASAGGLEAFGGFFSKVPKDTGMAFVLVQHLDPSHTSNMVELLGRYTKMPVLEAKDGIKLEPDHVYMIPPNRNMTIADRTLKLVAQSVRGYRTALTFSSALWLRTSRRRLSVLSCQEQVQMALLEPRQ